LVPEKGKKRKRGRFILSLTAGKKNTSPRKDLAARFGGRQKREKLLLKKNNVILSRKGEGGENRCRHARGK